MVFLLVLGIFYMPSGHMKNILCQNGREEDMITGTFFKISTFDWKRYHYLKEEISLLEDLLSSSTFTLDISLDQHRGKRTTKRY